MKHLTPLAAAAAFALSACGGSGEPETLDTRAPDPLARELANAAPVELPPSVRATVTFRCRDNSLVYVDFFTGDKQANFRTERGGPATTLTAPNAGEPLTADGYRLTGDPQSITLTQPGKPEQTCRA